MSEQVSKIPQTREGRRAYAEVMAEPEDARELYEVNHRTVMAALKRPRTPDAQPERGADPQI